MLDNLVKELRRYGFDFKKWASSHTELVSELPVEMRENADSMELFSEEYRIKALGISWQPNTDLLLFKVDLDEITELTKRAFRQIVGVATVQEEISLNQWKYVPSKDNAADMASRGLFASEVIEIALWWNGPELLSTDDTE